MTSSGWCRALEVYFLTGKPLTAHFTATASPLGDVRVDAFALSLGAEQLLDRITRRVDAQFASGLLDEVRGLLARGVPSTAHAFGGLVYRQVLELLQGVRDEDATRRLIVRENKRYAKRQLIWFRKESKLQWLQGPGEREDVVDAVCRALPDTDERSGQGSLAHVADARREGSTAEHSGRFPQQCSA